MLLFLECHVTNHGNVISLCISYIDYNKSENVQILAVLTTAMSHDLPRKTLSAHIFASLDKLLRLFTQ